MSFSYDYTYLLSEITIDLTEGWISITETVKIVRDQQKAGSYCPIVDYYYENFKVREPYEEVGVSDVIKEME